MNNKHIVTIARVLFGSAMLLFGSNLIFRFLPEEMPLSADAFMGALRDTGYMVPLIGITKMCVGALIIVNRFTALMLVVQAPITINGVLFHAVLFPATLAPALALTAIQLYLAWVYRDAYRPLLALGLSRPHLPPHV